MSNIPKAASMEEDISCDEETEVLEYIPGELYVRRIVRRKYALKGGEGVVIGELPTLPLPKSNAGVSAPVVLLVSVTASGVVL